MIRIMKLVYQPMDMRAGWIRHGSGGESLWLHQTALRYLFCNKRGIA